MTKAMTNLLNSLDIDVQEFISDGRKFETVKKLRQAGYIGACRDGWGYRVWRIK